MGHKESDMAEHARACARAHTHTHTHRMWTSACPTVTLRWCQPSLLPPNCTFQGHVCTVITGHPASGILESLLSEGMKDTWTPMWNWPGNRASHVDTGPMAAQMIQMISLPEARPGIHKRRTEQLQPWEKWEVPLCSPSQVAPAGCPTVRSF